ncbi:MAG TPA: Xaa-Pro peptidase family protein [Gaiellales bacterium]
MTPAAEIERRIGRLQAALRGAGLDAAVIVQHADMAYFCGTNQQAHLVVPANGKPRLLVRRVLDRARRESALERIEPLRSLSQLAGALDEMGIGAGAKVGFELDVLPAQAYLGYGRRLPGIELGDCTAPVRAVRALKSEWDLEQMRAASEQVRTGAMAVPALIGVGVSEADVQLEVERILRKAGHQGQLRFRGFNQEMHYGQILGGPSGAVAGYSDSPLCGPGPNAAIGKGPNGHVLARGDTVIADLVGGHEGWLSDQTRTFAVGAPPADMADAYDHAVAILRAAEQRLAPGAVPSALFALSEEMAAAAGLAEHFMGAGAERVRFLGHGVGMEIDELPILAPGFDEPLVEGNVVAIEPKFVFPGRGAVGIENLYAITATGFETLTTAPEELIVR